MSYIALGLVLLSAVLHATWNLFSKQAKGGLPFIWLFSCLMSVIYAPFALATFFLMDNNTVTPLWLVFMVGTGLLHIVYFSMLAKGYQAGELSLVYPLARGTGPLLATIAAALLLHERPSPLAISGILSIGLGVFVFMDGFKNLNDPRSRPAIKYALAIGTIIATYTIWDKYAVSVLMIPPVLYEWSGDLIRTIFFSFLMWNRWSEVRQEWQDHRKEAIGIAVLSPLAYILVLTALTFSPVSYIAPIREVSIVIGAMMGTYFLHEGDVTRRWSGALVIMLGVMALALG